MRVIHTIADFRTWRNIFPGSGPAPFAPTMGALHEGHASLIRAARTLAGDQGKVISSIFVNPTQFAPSEDFGKYPRTLDHDLSLLMANGCDAVFVPTAKEIYGEDPSPAFVTINPGPLGSILEGLLRPTHFAGVCTVVAKLLHITQPSHLLLGQKDYQQQVLLRQMCEDLNLPVEVKTCPTLREPDGLAMSSRNRYLTPDERVRSTAIYKALVCAKTQYHTGERNPAVLEATLQKILLAANFEIQYAVIAKASALQKFDFEINSPPVALIAVKLSTTRLIDNMLLDPEVS